MIFLPIETSGEGEVNAHSRVQMALGEAKVKAKTEFEQCLKQTGKSMNEIRAYIDEHPELKRPFYHVPHREGVAGTAAQFILARERPDQQRHALLEEVAGACRSGAGDVGRLSAFHSRDAECAEKFKKLFFFATFASRRLSILIFLHEPERNPCTTIRVRS